MPWKQKQYQRLSPFEDLGIFYVPVVRGRYLFREVSLPPGPLFQRHGNGLAAETRAWMPPRLPWRFLFVPAPLVNALGGSSGPGHF